MALVVTNTKEVIIAVVSNSNFFNSGSLPAEKIKQVCDLIEEVHKTMNK